MTAIAIIEWVFTIIGLLICSAGLLQFFSLKKRFRKIRKGTETFRNIITNRQSPGKIEQPALGLLLNDIQDVTIHDLLADASLYKDVKAFLKEYKNEVVIPPASANNESSLPLSP